MAQSRMKNKTNLYLIPLILLIAACSNLQKPAPRHNQPIPDYISQEGNIQHEVQDERVAQLWRMTETEYANGQMENALKHLNSALLLSPKDAVLWSRGAELYLTVQENILAENYAGKSNFYATIDSRSLKYRNWLIIKHAREMRGDLLGTRNAQQKVLKYQHKAPIQKRSNVTPSE